MASTPVPTPIPPELIPAMKAKLAAETAKLKLETEALEADNQAAAAEYKHQRAMERLELKTETARTHSAELEAEVSTIAADKVKEAEAERRAGNKFARIYVFDDPVNDASVNACIGTLDIWRRTTPGCDITLRFYSPGGDVIAGMYLFDYLRGLQRAGHRLITEAYGYAASMAGILLQVGDIRRVGRESYVLIHQIAFGVRGKIGEVEDEVAFVKKIQERVLDIFAEGAERANVAGTAAQALTRSEFKKRWERKDWWLSSEECLKYGVVDEIV